MEIRSLKNLALTFSKILNAGFQTIHLLLYQGFLAYDEKVNLFDFLTNILKV